MNNTMSSLDDIGYAACSLRPEKIVETTKGRSHNSDSFPTESQPLKCFLLPQYSSLSICHLVNLQRSQVWLIFSLIFCSAASQYLIKICKLFSDPCVGHHVVSLSLFPNIAPPGFRAREVDIYCQWARLGVIVGRLCQ